MLKIKSQYELVEILHQGLIAMGLPLDQQKEMQLIRYIKLIAKWNKQFRLTSIRDLETMVNRHLLDSLSVLPYVKGQTVLDVGTGAGFPGIPLAIAMPDRKFVLLDTSQKKTRFLKQTCSQMCFYNVHVVHKPVEDYQPNTLFDSVISRAFGTLRDFIIPSQHLVKPGGQILAMKSIYPLMELQDVTAPFKLINVYALKVPRLYPERHLIELNYQPEIQKETANV